MKINPNLDPQGSQATGPAGVSGSASAGHVSSSSQSSQTASTDKADLSSEAQQFARLSSQAAKVPDVRQDRVASLKTAIQSGAYSVSDAQIANAMQRDFKTGG